MNSKMHSKSQKKKSPAQKSPNHPNTRKVTVPVAKGDITSYDAAKFQAAKPGCIRVQKSEYISDIILAAEPYVVLADLAINAASKTVFPWLSGIASLYETYKFVKLAFEYKTQAPTITEGYVALAVDYNIADAPPSTKTEMFEMESTVRAPVWSDVKHQSKPANLSKRKGYFNLTDENRDILSEQVDPGLYDVGRLIVTSGNSNISVPGELWVHYDCELSTPNFDEGSNWNDFLYLFADSNPSNVGRRSPFGQPVDPTIYSGPDGILKGVLQSDGTNNFLTFMVQDGWIVDSSSLNVFVRSNDTGGVAQATHDDITLYFGLGTPVLQEPSLMPDLFQANQKDDVLPTVTVIAGSCAVINGNKPLLQPGDSFFMVTGTTYNSYGSFLSRVIVSCRAKRITAILPTQNAGRMRKSFLKFKREEKAKPLSGNSHADSTILNKNSDHAQEVIRINGVPTTGLIRSSARLAEAPKKLSNF